MSGETAPRAPDTGLPIDWALKSGHQSVHFSERQRCYLRDKFVQGEQQLDATKLDGTTASKAMRVSTDNSSNRLFGYQEFLSAQQISSYLSRLASKPTHGGLVELEVEDDREELAAAEESCVASMVQQLAQSLIPSHPIMVAVSGGSVDLCQALKDGSLNKQSVAQLMSVCEHFDLEVTAAGRH